MRFDERVVRTAAATLPRRTRNVRLEEWLADLDHAGELGIPRRDVAFGAVAAAVLARPRTMLSVRHRLAIGAAVLGGALIATPVVAVAAYAIDDARGIVTTERDADGSEQTVYWRDYPGLAGLDAEDVLAGPTLEEGIADGERMITEMEEALSAELGLDWAPPPIDDLTLVGVENRFGGRSMLVLVNSPTSQTTTVPRSWSDKERAIAIIGEITARYGFDAPILDQDSYPLTEQDLIRDYGGPTPAEQVLVSGTVLGPTGQWVMFSFQDLSKDTTGRFTEQADQSAEHGWERESLTIAYGANGLLPAEDRAEFVERLAPFAGYPQPVPQVS